MGRYVKVTLTFRPIDPAADGDGAIAAAGGKDDGKAGELVDAQLGRARSPGGAHSAGFFVASRNGSKTSIGSGKTTVVFWLLPISSRVCR